jgi:hypothetical protein
MRIVKEESGIVLYFFPMISWRSCLFADQPIHGVDFKENWPETKVFAFQTWMFPVPYIKTAKKLTLLGDDFSPNTVFTLRVLTARVEPGFDPGFVPACSANLVTTAHKFPELRFSRKLLLRRCVLTSVSCPLLELYVHVYTFCGRHETFGTFWI